MQKFIKLQIQFLVIKKIFFLLTFCFFVTQVPFLFSETVVFSLQNFFGKEEIQKAEQKLEKMKEGDTLVLWIQSTSGDLLESLSFAKKIYEKKEKENLHVIAYIDENALGPVAIFPFLADEILVSYFVSWGDISFQAEETLPVYILRSQIESLIQGNDSKAELLRILASGMADPALVVYQENGWKVTSKDVDEESKVIAKKNEALVLNQNQMKDLSLIDGVFSEKQFQERYLSEKIPTISSKESNKTDFEKQLTKHIHYSEKGPNLVGRIVIDDRKGGINQSTWLYVKQALDFYKEKKPILIILELNTPGGEVFAAQEISNALKEIDTQYGIPVITFINNWAISAGAMLAYSSRFITTVKDGSIGAAEPILIGAEGKPETASEKINSALRADFANRASFFERNPLIAEAMVDKDMILVLRRGKVIKLDSEDQIRKTGLSPDKVITAKGKLLTLDAREMIEYGVANYLFEPTQLTSITEKEKEEGRWPASKSLVFQIPYLKNIPDTEMVTYLMDWKTKFFVFLALPMVQSALFLAMLLGGYIEMNTPGFGLPGSVALTALFLILLSSFSLQIASALELIFLIIGLGLILVEVFILPSFGLVGIIGILLFLAGLIGIMVPGLSSVNFSFDTNTVNAAGEFVLYRLAWISGTLIVGLIFIALLAKYVMPSFSGFQKFVLIGGEQVSKEGYVAGKDQKSFPNQGEVGLVFSSLRPVGKVLIHDTMYDAITKREFLDKGTSVVVEGIEENMVVVRENTKKS